MIYLLLTFALALPLSAQAIGDLPPVGQTRRVEIGNGERHVYRVNLAAGQYLHVSIYQRGADVEVTLRGPDEKPKMVTNLSSGAVGEEVIVYIAEHAGEYRLEVRSPKRPRFPYDLTLVALREAQPMDRKRAQAEELLHSCEMEVLRKHRDADAQIPERLENARTLFREAAASDRIPAVEHTLGDYWYVKRSWAAALNVFNSTVRLKQESGDAQGTAYAKLMAAMSADRARQPELALRLGREASTELEREEDWWNAAYARNELARMLDISGADFVEAREQALRSIELYRRVGNRAKEISLRRNTSDLYRMGGDYRSALRELQLGLQTAREVSDNEGLLSMQSGMARLHADFGQYDLAIQALEGILADARKWGDRNWEASALRGLAVYRNRTGQVEQAKERMIESIAAMPPAKGRGEELNQAGAIARTYRELGMHEQALPWMEKTADIATQVGNRNQQANSIWGVANTLWDLGRREEALVVLLRANQIFRDNREPQNTNSSLLAASRMAFRLGQYEKAAAWQREVLLGAIPLNLPLRMAETFVALLRSSRALGQPDLAVFYGKQAVNTLQSLRANVRGIDRESARGFTQQHAPTYRELADLLIDQGRLPEAEQILQLLKEEEFFAFVRRDAGDTATIGERRAELTPQEAEWEKGYKEVVSRLVAIGTERGELVAKANRSAEETRRLEELEQQLTAGNKAFQAFLSNIGTASTAAAKPAVSRDRLLQIRESEGLKEDLAELPKGAVALYTLLGEEKYRVILITPDVQKAYEYPIKGTDLSRKILTFRQALQDPRKDVRPQAQELHRILIGPELAADLQKAKATTLMWSLDGALRYVPIATLHDGERYLLEQYGISIFTPASHARLKDKPSAQWKGVGLGVTKPHDGFPELPAVATELKYVIRERAGEPGVLEGRRLLDEQFTAAAMRATLREQPKAVHIASHFRLQPGDETRSYLLLGDGTHLTVGEMKTLPDLFRGVELLTLSACNTGVTASGADGAELEGLSVLAQRKGAKAVLATLWPAADESTSVLMREFYRRRQEGEGAAKAEALRAAQLSMLRQKDGAFAHPFFWAPFYLTGNWQ